MILTTIYYILLLTLSAIKTWLENYYKCNKFYYYKSSSVNGKFYRIATGFPTRWCPSAILCKGTRIFRSDISRMMEWPMRSPEISPFDFLLWGHLRTNDLEDIREQIVQQCRLITRQHQSSMKIWITYLSLHGSWWSPFWTSVYYNESYLIHFISIV